MRESHIEGLANRDDPESCAAAGNRRDEVLTGAHAGRDIEPRNQPSRVPTSSRDAEGNTGRTAIARCASTRRGQRPRARMEPLCARTGRSSSHLRRAMAPLVALGRPEAASR